MKKIILISGKAENGKSTAANYLKECLESFGNRVVITRFAYYLKDLAKRYCDWDGEKDEKGRSLLQTLGTDIIRQKLNKPNFHVSRICEDIEICKDYVDYVIIDDTRFPNEIYYSKAIFNSDVISVRINRINEDGSEYNSSLSPTQKNHISETALDNFDFDYIIKSSNIRELRKDIRKLFFEIV